MAYIKFLSTTSYSAPDVVMLSRVMDMTLGMFRDKQERNAKNQPSTPRSFNVQAEYLDNLNLQELKTAGSAFDKTPDWGVGNEPGIKGLFEVYWCNILEKLIKHFK